MLRLTSRTRTRLILPALAVACCVAASPAEAKKKPAAPEPEETKDSRESLAEIIGEAEKIEGLLTFYRSPEKLYMELPAATEGEPLGFSAVLVNSVGDFVMRGGAVDTQLVRWRRLGEHVVLRKENTDFRADPGSPMRPVVELAFPDSPAFAAPLVPLRDEPAPMLIDASKLFGPDLAQILSENAGFAVRPEDAILVSLKAFEDNVVARVSYRVRRERGEPGRSGEAGAGRFSRFLRPGRLADPRSAEVTVDYNFYRLPEDDFQPRFADERIGGFVVPYKDYSEIDRSDTLFRHLLSRWDVRQPITFYMDHSVPERWRLLVREGAEWWNSSFEKIGIQNAVRVLDPPDDPNWEPGDIHYSVIYWNLADNLVFSGAAGPSLVDPRTGKVLKANVYLNGEFFSFALNRYLVYAWWRAPGMEGETLRELRRNPRLCDREASFSSQLAFARLVLLSRGVLRPGTDEADRFAREAFLELVAHEVGHALGFPHNWKASLVSGWGDVRDGRVSGRVGSGIFSSSVMDYNPIYLAPKGEPQGDYFMREVGPYDDLAVEYLYRPLDPLSPEERARVLDSIAARAETQPGLIYDSGVLGGIDPTSNSDDYGDNPLSFAASRLEMLQTEVLPKLPELVLAEGHDYSLLRQALDSAIFSVAMDYIDIIARHVGGQILLRRVADSAAAPEGGAPPIVPVDADDQRRALQLLDRHVFAERAFALSPEILSQLKADLLFDWNYPWRFASDYDLGGRIAGLYETTLSSLLESARLARVLDNERRVAAGADRFTLPELFDSLERSAFDGLGAAPLSADRRALQRQLLGHLVRLTLRPESGAPAEASQLAARSLRSILTRIERLLASRDSLDAYTEAHLHDLAARARRTLDAKIDLSTD